MSDIDSMISDALENGADYLAMGEIAAHTGLLVSQAPRHITKYDIIINNIDMSKGCMVKVKHNRNKFKTKIKSDEYDFLVFVYAPSRIEKGVIKPRHGRDTDKQSGTDKNRGIYVFPKDVVNSAIDDESGTLFDPRNIKVNGIKDEKKYKEYRNAFHLILEMVPNSPAGYS